MTVAPTSTGCNKCGELTDIDFTFAFQPIVDIQNKTVFGYEALVRDPETKSAVTVLNKINAENRYAFDQACRTKAIALASQLGLEGVLSINFLPNAVYEPKHCIQSTLKAAKAHNFKIENIMFEVTESEEPQDADHLKNIFEYYQSCGFITALDDFGSGFSGLNLLAKFQPKILKLDMELARNIDQDEVKQTIVTSVVEMAHKLGMTILAEGIETKEELAFFKAQKVHLIQGYLLAKPGIETLPVPDYSMLV